MKLESKVFSDMKSLNEFLETIDREEIVSITPWFYSREYIPSYCLIYWDKVEEEIQNNTDNNKPFVFDGFPKYIQIILNGNPFMVSKNTLTYEEIVDYSKMNGCPTVIVSQGFFRLVLIPSQSVEVVEGMIINCTHTGNA